MVGPDYRESSQSRQMCLPVVFSYICAMSLQKTRLDHSYCLLHVLDRIIPLPNLRWSSDIDIFFWTCMTSKDIAQFCPKTSRPIPTFGSAPSNDRLDRSHPSSTDPPILGSWKSQWTLRRSPALGHYRAIEKFPVLLR